MSGRSSNYSLFHGFGPADLGGKAGSRRMPAGGQATAPLVLTILALALAGCSGPAMGLAASYSRNASIDVPYRADSNVKPVPGARGATVSVAATDGRTEDRDRVGTLRDIFGVRMGVIIATNDIPGAVGSAIEQELKARDFQVGRGHAAVAVKVLQFHDDLPPNGFGWSVQASVRLSVTILGPNKATLFAKVYEGAAQNTASANFDIVPQARAMLMQAFQNAVRNVVNDEPLQQAILLAQ